MQRRKFIKGMSASIVLPTLINPASSIFAGSNESFVDKLQPAIVGGGFSMDDYWVWDPSVVKGEDGLYHMFASRFSKTYGFSNWVTNSEIVRAVSDKPEGPYQFEEVVLGKRGGDWFDGKCTFNSRITKYKDKYLLFYVGVNYDFPFPEDNGNVWDDGRAQRAWMHKRAAYAVADSVYGPWKRLDQPVMDPRPGKWDASIISNPSPVVLPDGSVYLIYKSSAKDHNPPLLLGAALSENGYKGPYKRLSDKPIFNFHSTPDKASDVEDPFVWWADDHYELIMKDRFGNICGEEGGGIHATSKNGLDWKLSNPVKAYSRTVKWDDGTVTKQANFERPFLLFEDGKPTHLFAATGTGPRPYEVDKTWNMVMPLK